MRTARHPEEAGPAIEADGTSAAPQAVNDRERALLERLPG